MRIIFRLSSLGGILVLCVAVGLLVQINRVRAQRVTYVSSLTQAEPLPLDAASPTGYAGGIRQLIVPEHNNESYQWLAQTQQMLKRGEWRLRHVDYDNAPDGREIRSPSPYRWWLGLVTWTVQKLSGQPRARAVEQAALFADPTLQVLLLGITMAFTAWRFGALSASLLTLGSVMLFPFASTFLPGQPGDYGLSLVAALWSILPLLAGIRMLAGAVVATPGPVAANSPHPARVWFFIGGFAGGLGLWISVTRQLPVLLGLALGGLIATWLTRRDLAAKPLPWRTWAWGGGGASLVAFLIEYFPAHLELKSWRIETVHPLYAIAWLGGGELLLRLGALLRQDRSPPHHRGIVPALLALLAVVAVPAAIFLKDDHAWLTADALAFRLTNLPNSVVAENIIAWLARDHFTSAIGAAFVPLLLLGPAAGLLVRRTTAGFDRIALAVATGPLLVALALACFQLRWWNLFECTLLPMIVLVSAALTVGLNRWLWSGLVAAVLTPGLLQLLPPAGEADSVTETEVVALVERDLAHWLANRVGPEGAVVLAPPNLTTALYFHGGLRGMGTPYAENKEGFAAAVRLAAASSADEAQALIRKRGVTHIIMPSWEPFLDEYARLGSNQPEHTLVGLLHQWQPPRWLRPVPYQLPQIAGFEGQSVAIFEVVEVQDNATALSNLAEYFAEMGLLDQAAAVSHALDQSFSSDVGALVAQAQVALAIRDGAGFGRMISRLLPHLAEDETQALAWDRRVRLAIVLAEGKQFAPARTQVQRCLAEIDEPLMRSLAPLTLYRLQVLSKTYGLEISEPTLRELARRLLPTELRSAL